MNFSLPKLLAFTPKQCSHAFNQAHSPARPAGMSRSDQQDHLSASKRSGKEGVTRIISDVSAAQPQQAISDYLSPALYAYAFAAVVPAGRHSLPRTPVVEKSVEFPVASSREQPRCRLSHGFRFAYDAVAAWTDGASKLFQLDSLSWEWFQSEYL